MFSPENTSMPNWRELAHLRDVPDSTQLTFPLTISPKTTVGGHAIFLMSRNMRYGVTSAAGEPDEWFICVEDLDTREKRTFPVNVVDRSRGDCCELLYARRC